jgi:hypothetical protein
MKAKSEIILISEYGVWEWYVGTCNFFFFLAQDDDYPLKKKGGLHN